MNISIIGAGRVGRTLGFLAHKQGYKITDVVCRSIRSARAATKFIGAGTPQSIGKLRLSPADIILISTSDDAIEEVAQIIGQQIFASPRSVAFHTSGAKSSSAIHRLAEAGISVASCHPLQTFESAARSVDLIPSTWFCIEGEKRAVHAARRFVRKIGARYFEIATEMKSLYHAAAVLASGGVTALVSISLEMLTRAGLTEREAGKALMPLVEGTVANVREVGVTRALTGPVRRGDAGTVSLNMKAIKAIDKEWLEIYRLLARRSLTIGERSGGDPQALTKLYSLLKKGEDSYMENLTLVYGMRLIKDEEIGAVEHAQVLTEGGQMRQVTMHTIEGTREQIRKQLIESIDAFFEIHS